MWIGILGPLEVAEHGRPLELGGARLRALLTLLALDTGRLVPAERLIDDMWEDRPPNGAPNALQSLISRLRAVVGRDLIESRPNSYRLIVPRADIDAYDFEARVVRARSNADPAARSAELDAALALWRGPALADVARLPFAEGPIARLEGLRLSALEDRIEADLALGRHAELIPELESLAAADPLREPLRVRLMRALYGAGRQAEALAVYEDTKRSLNEALGVDPSPDLESTYLSVLRQDPTLLPPSAPELPAPRRSFPTSGAAPALAMVPEESFPAPARIQPESPPSNLRARLTSFIGRDEDLKRVCELLDEARLVTLTGPGGAGKTRLSLESGDRMLDRLKDGVWFVELAPVGDPAEVPHAVLSALGLRETAIIAAGRGRMAAVELTDPLDRLTAALGDKRMLVLLDNCEHLLDAAARLADRLLADCPGVRVLATSREPLGITGESLWPVEPLGLPPLDAPPDEAVSYPAVRLFADRGRAVRPGFGVADGNVAQIVRICRALDGMPLAIELAAARLRSLTAEQIAERLDDRFRLLAGGSRTALPRHQTLRAVVEWSWDLLDDAERALWRRLSVFAGGATVESAEAVCADHPLAPPSSASGEPPPSPYGASGVPGGGAFPPPSRGTDGGEPPPSSRGAGGEPSPSSYGPGGGELPSSSDDAPGLAGGDVPRPPSRGANGGEPPLSSRGVGGGEPSPTSDGAGGGELPPSSYGASGLSGGSAAAPPSRGAEGGAPPPSSCGPGGGELPPSSDGASGLGGGDVPLPPSRGADGGASPLSSREVGDGEPSPSSDGAGGGGPSASSDGVSGLSGGDVPLSPSRGADGGAPSPPSRGVGGGEPSPSSRDASGMAGGGAHPLPSRGAGGGAHSTPARGAEGGASPRSSRGPGGGLPSSSGGVSGLGGGDVPRSPSRRAFGGEPPASSRGASGLAGGGASSPSSHWAGGGAVRGAELDVLDVFDSLSALVEKSLVLLRAQGSQAGRGPRYLMLETIRAYGWERLVEAGETEELRRAHAEYFLGLVETAEPELHGHDQVYWLGRLAAEHDNLHAALRWATSAGEAGLAVRFCASLGWYWWLKGHWAEGNEAAAEVLAMPNLPANMSTAVAAALSALTSMGGPRDMAEIKGWLRMARDISATLSEVDMHPVLRLAAPLLNVAGEMMDARSLSATEVLFEDLDPWVRAMGRYIHGQIAINMGRVDVVDEDFAVALEGFRTVGDRWGISFVLTAQAELYTWRGEHEEAIALYREALRLVDELGIIEGAVWHINARLANELALHGERDAAEELLRDALRAAERHGAPETLAAIHHQLGEFARREGDRTEAIRRLARAEDLTVHSMTEGPPQFPAMIFASRGLLEAQTGDLEAAREWHRQALEFAARSMDNPIIALVLMGHADLAERDGDPVRAVELLGIGDGLRGMRDLSIPDAARLETSLRTTLGQEDFTTSYERGKATDLDAALAQFGLKRPTRTPL